VSAADFTSTRRRCWVCGCIRPTRPVPTPDACRSYPVCGSCVPVKDTAPTTTYLVVLDHAAWTDSATVARIFRYDGDGPRLVLDVSFHRLAQARAELPRLTDSLQDLYYGGVPATVTVTALQVGSVPRTVRDWA